MPDEVLNKIKFLCKSIPKVEWSGLLFYSIEGSITDLKNFKVTLQDILPMDMGTSAFTSYNIDDRYVQYIMDDESRMDWLMGHIHSHNTMSVFFSGTDMEELQDNSPSHNFYLSLIVNNYMDFTAKISFIGKVETTTEKIPYYALNENGEKYIIEEKEFNITNEKLFVIDCDILSRAEQILVESGFEDKVKEIMKPKPVENMHQQQVNQQFPNNQQSQIANRMLPEQKPLINTLAKKVGKVEEFLGKVKDKSHPNVAEDHTEIEVFALTLLNFTNMLDAEDTIDTLMEDIEELEVPHYQLASTVVDTFATLFEHFFPFYDEEGRKFIQVLEGVIEYFEDHEEEYPILKMTIDRLKQLKVKFEDYGTTATA